MCSSSFSYVYRLSFSCLLPSGYLIALCIARSCSMQASCHSACSAGRSRVCVAGANSHRVLEAFMAISAAGCIVCPLNLRWSDREVQHAVHLTKAAILVSEPGLKTIQAAALVANPNLQLVHITVDCLAQTDRSTHADTAAGSFPRGLHPAHACPRPTIQFEQMLQDFAGVRSCSMPGLEVRCERQFWSDAFPRLVLHVRAHRWYQQHCTSHHPRICYSENRWTLVHRCLALRGTCLRSVHVLFDLAGQDMQGLSCS